MKYLDSFLKAERQPNLPSVPSVPNPERIEISTQEEEDKKRLFKADSTDKADKRGHRQNRQKVQAGSGALTELTEALTEPRRGRYVPGPEICSWCRSAIATVPGVLALARRTACGDLLHPKCWTESTRDPGGHQPKTPTLDRLIAEADARAEREKA